jgi:hypothetical protein
MRAPAAATAPGHDLNLNAIMDWLKDILGDDETVPHPQVAATQSQEGWSAGRRQASQQPLWAGAHVAKSSHQQLQLQQHVATTAQPQETRGKKTANKAQLERAFTAVARIAMYAPVLLACHLRRDVIRTAGGDCTCCLHAGDPIIKRLSRSLSDLLARIS